MSWLRKLNVETVLPRILAVCGAISLIVYFSLYSEGGKFTYSHSSYVALGISIGFYSSSVISALMTWLLKPKNQKTDTPVLR